MIYTEIVVLWDRCLKKSKDKNKKVDALLEIAVSFGVKREEMDKKNKKIGMPFVTQIKKKERKYQV